MRILFILVTFASSLSLSAQTQRSFVHQFDISGKFHSITYKSYTQDYPKIYDVRASYMPSIVFDSSYYLSLLVGFDRTVSNFRSTLNFSRTHTILYGIHTAYQFRKCENYPIQLGATFSFFNDFVLSDNNGQENSYEQNGYETALYIAPVLKWHNTTILPKLSLIYRERSQFRNLANESNVYSQLGLQVII